MVIPEAFLKIELFGVVCLVANVAGLFLIFRSRDNYPQDPSIVVHNRKMLWLGKIIVGLSMMFLSLMPMSLPIASVFAYYASLLGPLYFPIAIIIDAVAYVALHVKEWCNQDLAIALNFMNIPLITLALGCYVYAQSIKSVVRAGGTQSSGIVLGYVEMAVRRVTSVKIPETCLGTSMVLQNEKWEVRRTPGRMPYIYNPESRSNPHICITGSSGVGKTTTTIYIVSELLRKRYPVIVFDPKGDISMTAVIKRWYEEKNGRKKKVLIVDVGGLGVDPLQPVSDESFMERVTDLINAMSVVEEVGANQKYLIVRSAEELEEQTYRALLERVENHVEEILKAGDFRRAPRYGPHIRDAYMGIRSKMEILSTVFKENPKLNISILNPAKWPQNVAGVILNFSRIRDRYARAVTMELLLRKLEQVLKERGPLAFLTQRKVFIVVDEAHELARSQKWRSDVTVSILEDMAREARSHGAGLILVSQRLADIPDGIRMNMGLWLCLRTDSPYDIQILRTVMPVGRLPEIVTSMPEGYALVVEAMPRRLERMESIRPKPTAVEEGYIVKLERKMAEIKGSAEKASQDLKDIVEKINNDVLKVIGVVGSAERSIRDPIGYVIEKASRELDGDEKRRLNSIPRDVVESFLGGRDDKELFVKYGLLEFSREKNRFVLSRIGRTFKKIYMEVARD